MKRLPPLNSLRAFEAVATALSFKQAARELSVTPTAISHQIKVLEEFLGQPLFRRLTRAIALTPQGEAMLPKVREGFANLAEAVELVRRREEAGIVSICTPPSFAARWLVPRLGNFARTHPEIDLRLSSSLAAIDSRDGAAGERTADLGAGLPYDLTVRFGRGNYPGYSVASLFSPSYVVVCSPTLLDGDHPLERPEDLRWHTLIQDSTVPDLDDRPGWANWLQLAGVEGWEEMLRGPHFEDAALAVEAAIAGHGAALAARPLVSADLAIGRLVMPFELAIPSRYAYYVISPPATANKRAVVAVRDWLIQEAAQEAGRVSGEDAPPPIRG